MFYYFLMKLVVFYPRDAILARVLDVVVCLFATRRYCIETAKHIESRKQRHTIAQTRRYCVKMATNTLTQTPPMDSAL